MSDSAPRRWPLFLALCLHVALGWGYLASTAVWEGPDELGHFLYARHLLRHGELPVIRGQAERNERPAWSQSPMAHHPPLYYALLAATQRALDAGDLHPVQRSLEAGSAREPGRAGGPVFAHGLDEVAPLSVEVRVFRALRSLSLLFGAVSIALTYALGRAVFPARPAVAGLGAILLACLPTWSAAHAVLDNGALAIPLALLTLLLLVRTARGRALSFAEGAGIGAALGLALLTKLTAIVLVPVAVVALGLAVTRAPRRGRALAAALLAASVAAVFVGPFLARNALLYGDPLATAAHEQAYAASVWPEGYVGTALRALPRRLFEFTLCSFGWVSPPPPPGLVPGALLLLALSAVGWLRSGRTLLERPVGAALLALTCALMFAAVLRYNATFNQPQGRYLFPAAGPFALLLAAGLTAVHRRALPLLAAIAVWAAAAVLLLYAGPRLAQHLPRPGAHFASLVLDTTTVRAESEREIDLLSPPAGAELTDPPRFTWRPRSAGVTGPFTLHVFTADRSFAVGTYEDGDVAIGGTSFECPPALWDRLPIGRLVSWKVRALPDRGRGEEVRHSAESGAASFVRTE